MSCYLGLDIGAVSATAALLIDGDTPSPKSELFENLGEVEIGESDATLWLMNYRRTHGRPLEAAADVLDAVTEEIGLENLSQLSLTGSGAELVAGKMGIEHINEFKAVAAGLAAMGINARTVFEMGGETSKYVLLDRNDDGSYSILDYATNGDCAAGTGSFIDQQAGRLKYNIEDIGDICLDAERSAQVAGRCSVFAKSDMIHAQQKGYNPAEVLRGLCNAVARNFRTAVVRSHAVEAPVAFIGGVTANKAVVRAMAEAFEMDVDELVIPEEGRAHVPAVGAAAVAAEAGSSFDADSLQRLHASTDRTGGKFPTADPLTMENVILLRDRVETYQPPADGVRVNAFLGIDIGSVSTNLVLLDEEGRLIDEIYVRTKGRPIEVVSDALKQIEADWGDRVTIRGVGTTGSGRELVGELVGADTINDEITCHKTGATFIGNKYLGGRTPDTIFEIGGQDSKYISLQDGIVVD
ncbi:MAG: BadF/BadG/BcrA/BcrD ATPase family protein, partial [Phycisphaerae bacterium]